MPSSPPGQGYLGEPLLVDMVHHHHLVIKRSARPSRAVGWESRLRYETESFTSMQIATAPGELLQFVLSSLCRVSQAIRARPSGALSLGPGPPAPSGSPTLAGASLGPPPPHAYNHQQFSPSPASAFPSRAGGASPTHVLAGPGQAPGAPTSCRLNSPNPSHRKSRGRFEAGPPELH